MRQIAVDSLRSGTAEGDAAGASMNGVTSSKRCEGGRSTLAIVRDDSVICVVG